MKDKNVENIQIFDLTSLEYSDWVCYLFGSHNGFDGIIWTPKKGKEPNRFWRIMQYLCFGNKWIKK